MADVAAIILAAGESLRFGRAKQLLQFRGQSLVEIAINAATGGGCRPVIVVTGSESEQVAAAIADKQISIVENGEWREGMGSSIRTGLLHLLERAPQTDAAVLMVCDQPFVSGEMINGLVDQWRKTGKAIVASAYSNTLGVPALFDRSCFDELLQLGGDCGAKPIILKDPDRVGEIIFSGGSCDIDTIDDWKSIDDEKRNPR